MNINHVDFNMIEVFFLDFHIDALQRENQVVVTTKILDNLFVVY